MLFERLRRGDVLVHHPYESFEGSVEGFLRAAARDPAVRVLMSTIYRTGGSESGIVNALEGAAARGKQVVVLIELKARFDEAANLERARGLERAGAHVIYGVVGLKTHAKIALVVREEEGRPPPLLPHRHRQLQPGHRAQLRGPRPADREPAVCRDVAELFGRLTSGSGSRRYERLLVAPESLRRGMLDRIAREGRSPDGHIVAKLNNLADAEIIDALYAASRGGAEHRPGRAQHLLPAARPAGSLGAHPRALRAGPLPGAQPRVPLRLARARATSTGSARRTS